MTVSKIRRTVNKSLCAHGKCYNVKSDFKSLANIIVDYGKETFKVGDLLFGAIHWRLHGNTVFETDYVVRKVARVTKHFIYTGPGRPIHSTDPENLWNRYFPSRRQVRWKTDRMKPFIIEPSHTTLRCQVQASEFKKFSLTAAGICEVAGAEFLDYFLNDLAGAWWDL